MHDQNTNTTHAQHTGADLFFTRVSPAKAFDCLGEDFNYASLILAVLGLASLSWIANWYANKSDLEKAWK